MSEQWGVLASALSTVLGGTSVWTTRYLVGTIDLFATAALRFRIGFAFLLTLARLQPALALPSRKDWPPMRRPADRSSQYSETSQRLADLHDTRRGRLAL
ncbi:hypothetical protein CDEF62S_04354 [Castellaniella defragrans]